MNIWSCVQEQYSYAQYCGYSGFTVVTEVLDYLLPVIHMTMRYLYVAERYYVHSEKKVFYKIIEDKHTRKLFEYLIEVTLDELILAT